MTEKQHGIGFFERYLTLWVGLCIVTGILLGAYAPEFAKTLDGMSINVNDAPVISIPIAVCLFFMMYPITEQRGREQRGREQRGRVLLFASLDRRNPH